jgi:hypothetical protein
VPRHQPQGQRVAREHRSAPKPDRAGEREGALGRRGRACVHAGNQQQNHIFDDTALWKHADRVNDDGSSEVFVLHECGCVLLVVTVAAWPSGDTSAAEHPSATILSVSVVGLLWCCVVCRAWCAAACVDAAAPWRVLVLRVLCVGWGVLLRRWCAAGASPRDVFSKCKDVFWRGPFSPDAHVPDSRTALACADGVESCCKVAF